MRVEDTNINKTLFKTSTPESIGSDVKPGSVRGVSKPACDLSKFEGRARHEHHCRLQLAIGQLSCEFRCVVMMENHRRESDEKVEHLVDSRQKQFHCLLFEEVCLKEL